MSADGFTQGYDLVAPTPAQRAAFAALERHVRAMGLIFAGAATTPAKLERLKADCLTVTDLAHQLRRAR